MFVTSELSLQFLFARLLYRICYLSAVIRIFKIFFFLSNYSSFALLLRFYWTVYINNDLQYGSSSSLYVACISEAKGLIILMYIKWDCGPFREEISNKTKTQNSEQCEKLKRNFIDFQVNSSESVKTVLKKCPCQRETGSGSPAYFQNWRQSPQFVRIGTLNLGFLSLLIQLLDLTASLREMTFQS